MQSSAPCSLNTSAIPYAIEWRLAIPNTMPRLPSNDNKVSAFNSNNKIEEKLNLWLGSHLINKSHCTII